MPKSKVRKKNDFTVSAVSRTPVKVKVGPSSVWFVALFIGLMLIGLVWLMVFQLAAVGSNPPAALMWMHNLFAWNSRKLAFDLAVHKAIGDDPKILLRTEGQKPVHGLLDHGLFAIQREHLLGQLAPAARPESGAAATGQNDWIKTLCAQVIAPGTEILVWRSFWGYQATLL